MSLQTELRAWAVASAAVFCLSAIGYRVVKAPDLSQTVATLNATLANADSAAANLNATISQVNGAILPAAAQLQSTLQNVNKATGAWSDASHEQVATVAAIERDLRAEMWQVDRTLIAAQGTIKTAQGSLDHVGPLLDSSTATVDAARAFINRPALAQTVDNAASITQHAAGVTADAHKVADKMTADYLKPVPWYLWPVKKGSQLLDIGAAVARHTP